MNIDGMFGPISVVDMGPIRELRLNGQVQGAAFLKPDLDGISPGPIFASRYMNGWLLAGCDTPTAHGCMIGLGSGAGAIGLLYNFPDITLDIVEIDPVTIKAAVEGFPLLNYYMDQGRLNIICKDANNFFGKENYTFGLADAYTGQNKLVEGYILDLAQFCKNTYINYIDIPDGEATQNLIKTFRDIGLPLVERFSPAQYTAPKMMQNWIFSNADASLESRDGFVPYQDIIHPAADRIQRQWSAFLGTREQIDG